MIAREADRSLITLTYIIYGMHLFSAVTGVMTSAFVVTAFLTGWPSLLAVILNYVKRGDTYGTYLDSHFSWQIKTFWYSATTRLRCVCTPSPNSFRLRSRTAPLG